MFGLLLTAGMSPGCATLSDMTDEGGFRPYGGIRFAYEYITYPRVTGAPWTVGDGWKAIALYPVMTPLLVLDVPLSLVVDTLCLPATIAVAFAQERDQGPQSEAHSPNTGPE